MKEPTFVQFSEGDYLRWEGARAEKAELHHGFVVAFAGGTIEHNQLALRMRDALKFLYPEPSIVFTSDVKIKISADMFLYPDAGVVCEAVDVQLPYVERPRIVVEVLSPSTRGYDIIEKRAAYRSLPSLHAYVIVHSDIRRVEIDVRGLGGTWQTVNYENHESVLLGSGVIPIADIYGPLVTP